MLKIGKYLITESKDNFEYVKKFNKNIALITTPVDPYRYYAKTERKENYPVVIGWIGSPSTAQYLEILNDVFRTLTNRYKEKISIKLIGSGKLDWKDISYKSVEWNLATESEQLQSFDIGVMPLEDDEWCRGKGGYKLIQYMAVGIPCVASSVGMNREIVRNGTNGFLVRTTQEWIDKISNLIEDPNLRMKIGKEGRRMVERYYSYEENVSKLVFILKKINSQR